MSASPAVVAEAISALAALALPLAELAVRATLLFAFGFLADRLLRRAPAAARHALWAATFAGLALLPLLAPVLPGVALPVLPGAFATSGSNGSPGEAGGGTSEPGRSAAWGGAPPSPAEAARADASAAELSTAGAERAAADGGPAPVLAAAAALVALALGGTVFAAGYLLLGILGAWLLVRRARPLDAHPRWRALLDGAVAEQRPRRRPALAASGSVGVPLLCGLLRHTILLPAAADGWSEEERRRVLAHEVAHAARRDGLLQVAARGVAALYWWHPAAGRALSRLVLTAELACDDRVLASGAGGADYARQLLDLAHRAAPARRTAPAPQPVAVAMARRPDLTVRIRALLDEARPRGPLPRTATAIGVAAVLAAAVLVAPVRLVAADEGFTTLRAEVRPPAARRQASERLAAERHRMTPLMRAVLAGDETEVRRLLDSGADPDRGVSSLGTPLILAAAAGDARLVELLLERGADPNHAETGGERPGGLQRTPLGSAARAGDLATVERLLAAGAAVDAAPRGDATPLMTAAHYGHEPLVRRFLAAGADVDARIPGDGTPLIEAARSGHLDIVELLLAAGAPPDTAVRGDGNPLVMAAAEGHREVLDRLLEAGADPNMWVPGDESALYHAIERGDAWMVERLIAAGADVTRRWPEDEGPLALAAQAGNRRVLELLWQAGARR